ncbi:MAG: hypothetical protein IJS55_04185 [Oscillospiraceae bacterium]|nr:hypothetical protein [Oscillospiraceae bacterium]
MKRMRGIIAIFLLLALLLTACGQSSQTPPKAEEPEDTAPVVVEPVQPEQEEPAQSLVFSDQPANVFRAKFEGSNVAGKGEAVDGVYRFTTTKTDGEAWHVKLESNYMTVPGRDYRVTYHFNSDVAGTVKFGDFHEFAIRKGENSVTGQVSASNGYTYLDLQLGALMPFTIDFTSIEVEELETEADYESVMTVPIAWSSEGAVYVQHDPGYFYKLDRHLDGVTMKVEEIPFGAEVWMSRLYVKTAAILAPGALYRVSADVSATHEMDMEVCFNNGDNEKGYGAFYGQRMGDMSRRTFRQLIDLRSPGSEGGEVVLQFAFGKSPDGSQVTVDNIRVEKVYEHYTNMLPAYFAMNGSVEAGTEYETAPGGYETMEMKGFAYDGVDNVYEWHMPEYTTALHESEDSATLDIVTAPDQGREVWKVKLFVDTGVTLHSDKAYRISADVSATGEFGYELCYNNGGTEKGVGALYGLTASTDARTVVYEVTGTDAGLVLQLAVGNAASGTSVTVKNVKVEEIAALSDNLMTRELRGAATVRYTADGAYQFTGSADGSTATMAITSAPDSDQAAWKAQMKIDTGIPMEKDSRYYISFKLNAAAALPNYEATLDGKKENGDDWEWAFGGFGGDANRSLAQGDNNVEFWTTTENEDRGELTIRLLLGNTGNTAGNTVTIKDIVVKKFVPAGDELFTGALALNSNVFENHYDGMEQFTSADGGAVTLNVTKAMTGGGVWSSILKVQPGVAMKAGKRYRVSVDVASNVDTGSFELLLRKGYDDNADSFAGLWGQSLAANGSATLVKEFDYFDGPDTDLVLRFQLGNLPAGAQFTVSNMSIRELAPGDDNLMTRELASEASVEAWAHEGYSAALTADGEKATLAVTSPAEGREVWKTKLFVHTGIQLTAGKLYRVSADVAANNEFSYEICYNKNDQEKGFDARYGLTAKAAGETVVQTMTAGGDGELVLQLSVGNAPGGTNVTVQNVKVQAFDTPGDNLAGALKYNSIGFFNVNADGGYVTKLTQAAKSVSFAITEAPAQRNPWNVKLNARTGFFPKSGKSYRVRFDIVAEKSQDKFEVFYDGSTEKVFGELYEQRLSAGEKRTVSHTIQGVSGQGELSIQIRLGATNGADGNSYTISNIRVEQVNYVTTLVPVIRSVTELWTHEDYAAELTATAGAATVRMTTVPAQGKEAWKTKLFVETGAKLQAGQKYRITFTVVGSNGMPYEICLNHGGEEKGLGGIFGLSGNAGGEPITYVTTPDKDIDLVLQFSLGNAAPGNTLTVRNLRVEKAGASDTVSNVTYTF